MMAAILVFAVLYMKRGHPKNWRIGERWVSMWGGDWSAMVNEMNEERRLKELHWRREKYIELINVGYQCEGGDHNLCFEKLCVIGDCELDDMIEKHNMEAIIKGNKEDGIDVESQREAVDVELEEDSSDTAWSSEL